jgi:hypothetical protein
MNIRASFFLVTLAIALAGCASHTPNTNVSTADLPDIQTGHYKVTPYLRAAVALQSLDHAAALKRLHTMAKSRGAEAQVIILCRMLFTARPASDFRRPRIGAASFFGGTDYSDWPLEPVELVDGVPFLVTRGYRLGGLAELAEWYLSYCETSCDWSSFRYAIKSESQTRDALSQLLSSPKWKTPLDADERRFFTDQIQ